MRATAVALVLVAAGCGSWDGRLRPYFAGHELDGSPPEHFAIGMLTAPLLSSLRRRRA